MYFFETKNYKVTLDGTYSQYTRERKYGDNGSGGTYPQETNQWIGDAKIYDKNTDSSYVFHFYGLQFPGLLGDANKSGRSLREEFFDLEKDTLTEATVLKNEPEYIDLICTDILAELQKSREVIPNVSLRREIIKNNPDLKVVAA